MNRNVYKIVAVTAIVSLIVPLFLYLAPDSSMEGNKAQAEPGDLQTAADISNMTGVPSEDIMNLKATGMSWNEVLEQLKSEDSDYEEDKATRLASLTEAGTDEDMVERMLGQGYEKEQILEAKMLAERVKYQLDDLSAADQSAVTLQVSAIRSASEQEQDEREAVYKQIADSFAIDSVVPLMLQLEEELGGLQQVLDEYLFALQAELNLADYLTDKDAYEEKRSEKRALIGFENIVTAAAIEQAMLDSIRKETEEMAEAASISEEDVTGPKLSNEDNASALPDNPVPVVTNLKPQNPAEDIMNEIERLNPNK